MNKIKQFASLLLVAFLLVGCQTTLQEGGAYKGDTVLYHSDQTIISSYRMLRSFVKWEQQYRSVLPLEATQAADYIRANAEIWIESAFVLRDAYTANPTDENLSALQRSLFILDAALATASKYVSEYGPKPEAPATN